MNMDKKQIYEKQGLRSCFFGDASGNFKMGGSLEKGQWEMKKINDIETMNTNKHIFIMSLPIFVELLLQLLVGNVDQMMVSRISQNSVASIVNANQIINLLIILLSMTATAITILLSRDLGAKDEENSFRTCMVSFLLTIVISLLATALVFWGYESLFEAIHVPEEIFEETARYLLIVGGFILVQGLYLAISAMLRAFALMKEVMIVSVIMNLINIIGNVILINGWFGIPQLGAIGAAISTDISKLIGLILMIILLKKKTGIRLSLSYLNPFPGKILKDLCMLAIPSGIESFSYNLSQVVILGIINSFGTLATITKGYCYILANVDYVYSLALATATQIILGYLIGARMIPQIEKRVNASAKAVVAISVGIATLLFLARDYVFLLFTDHPEIIALGGQILLIEIFLEFGRALNIIMVKCLIAVGEVITPTVLGIASQWCVSLAGAWLLGSYLGWGLPGVWIAMAIDECLRGVIFTIQFKRGKWKRHFQPG